MSFTMQNSKFVAMFAAETFAKVSFFPFCTFYLFMTFNRPIEVLFFQPFEKDKEKWPHFM